MALIPFAPQRFCILSFLSHLISISLSLEMYFYTNKKTPIQYTVKTAMQIYLHSWLHFVYTEDVHIFTNYWPNLDSMIKDFYSIVTTLIEATLSPTECTHTHRHKQSGQQILIRKQSQKN